MGYKVTVGSETSKWFTLEGALRDAMVRGWGENWTIESTTELEDDDV